MQMQCNSSDVVKRSVKQNKVVVTGISKYQTLSWTEKFCSGISERKILRLSLLHKSLEVFMDIHIVLKSAC